MYAVVSNRWVITGQLVVGTLVEWVYAVVVMKHATSSTTPATVDAYIISIRFAVLKSDTERLQVTKFDESVRVDGIKSNQRLVAYAEMRLIVQITIHYFYNVSRWVYYTIEDQIE